MSQATGATEEERWLHERCLAQDRTGFSRLVELYFHDLVREVRARNDYLHDEHLVYEAVIQALMNYFARPDSYNPQKLPLLRYLVMSARGDLKNLVEKHRRIDSREAPLTGGVEDQDGDTEQEIQIAGRDNVESEVLERMSDVSDRLDKAFPDPEDRAVAELILDGVRATAAYAEVLGITDWPIEAQAEEVKRRKDKVKKRMQRGAEKLLGGIQYG